MNESYAERGYAERGYAERGYAERGYPERGYARGGQKNTRAGGVVLAAVAFLSAFLVILGLYYAAGDRERHKVALAAADCEPNLSPPGLPCTTVQMLASQYMTITTPVIQQVNADVAAYTANERHHLTAAEAALRAIVTVENGFGTSLARFPFPPAVAPVAKALIQANQAGAKLIAEQARSSSLPQLRSFNHRVKAAGAAVQADMNLTRKALALRPTPNQEP
jgi:hypothetical protein